MALVVAFGDAVSAFGLACKTKLAGPGDREAAIRSPIERLITDVAAGLGLIAVPYDEVRDTDRAVRPDYAISVGGAITGYIEVKRPGASVDPSSFTGHNKRQWDRQRDLPNLIYTNGTDWWLWRDGALIHDPVHLAGGPLDRAGAALSAPSTFLGLLTDFLRWSPAPITTVVGLVQAIAPLTRLLRGEVLDQLAEERRAIAAGAAEHSQPFLGLARDWRDLLFPTASDEVFADGYAQAVTFALLLARTEGIALEGSLHTIGTALGGAQHTLMGRALQLLTDNVAADFKVTLDLLVRLIAVVDWPRVRGGKRDTYLHLYERFLEVYDPELRKQSGSYYTPHQVVEQMVRLTEQALVTRLGKADGFADPGVVTVDPAMGTGTYLDAIIMTVAASVKRREGKGAIPAAISALAGRLIGFELQMGPYAVAELRTSGLLDQLEASAPRQGMRMYVTDTLDDPIAEVRYLTSGLEPIAASRRAANAVKNHEPVTVVIGNPPYRERAEGMGGWIERGDGDKNAATPLDRFRADGNGLAEYVLKNLYVYFWRWGTWKVFDHHHVAPGGNAGIVCFISTSGYLRGPGFKGMREYLRRTCSEGWIIDLTPEGQTPDVPTRVFPGVRQPLAIGLFVRATGTSTAPAVIRYRAVHGRQAEKFDALAAIDLHDDAWREARTDWQAPFTPAAAGAWDEFPALSDLIPWVSPGMAASRTWVYAPSRTLLDERWKRIVNATSDEEKQLLFKESRDATLNRKKEPLPGVDSYQGTRTPFRVEAGPLPSPVRVGYRAFDRQWIIPDYRLLHAPSPALWAGRAKGQIFIIEQHAHAIASGPGIVFSNLIPEKHYFKGSEGGRALPMQHPNGQANVAPGLLDVLGAQVSGEAFSGGISVEELVAYIAGVIAHPAFTARFTDELTTPGIRVPLTADPALWAEAVEVGRAVVWAHTYGESMADPACGRPAGDVRFPPDDERRIRNLAAVTGMPSTIGYDEESRQISLGTGTWGPVSRAVFDYAVGGKNVIRSWFNYRKAVPGGKKTSPLDHMHLDAWPGEWSAEFTDLLSVLARLVGAEAAQAALLDSILDGPLLTMTALAEHGVRWPTVAADRRPRYVTAETPPTEPAPGQLF